MNYEYTTNYCLTMKNKNKYVRNIYKSLVLHPCTLKSSKTIRILTHFECIFSRRRWPLSVGQDFFLGIEKPLHFIHPVYVYVFVFTQHGRGRQKQRNYQLFQTQWPDRMFESTPINKTVNYFRWLVHLCWESIRRVRVSVKTISVRTFWRAQSFCDRFDDDVGGVCWWYFIDVFDVTSLNRTAFMTVKKKKKNSRFIQITSGNTQRALGRFDKRRSLCTCCA